MLLNKLIIKNSLKYRIFTDFTKIISNKLSSKKFSKIIVVKAGLSGIGIINTFFSPVHFKQQ